MKPLHIHTRAQNHPDKQKSHKSRYMSRLGGCSPALAAINVDPSLIVMSGHSPASVLFVPKYQPRSGVGTACNGSYVTKLTVYIK